MHRRVNIIVGLLGVLSIGACGGGDYGGFSTVASPVNSDLKHVAGSAPDDIWAVGLAGSVVHYDGTSWTLGSASTGETLSGVWAASRTDAWIVGGDDTVLHWDGSSWSSVQVPITDGPSGVWGSGPSDVWVSSGASDQITHWDGQQWSKVQLADDMGTQGLVWGTGANDVWLLRDITTSFQHWDGTSWSTVPLNTSGLFLWYGIWGSSPSDVWVIGNDGAQSDLALHWDGAHWSRPQISLDLQGSGWMGIWGHAANDIWAVGPFGTVAHFDGSTWNLMDSSEPSGPILFALWGSSGGLWGVGANGVLAHHN